MALANRPPLLLADEPTGELDNQMADQIFDLLQEMNRTFGVTVVVVTHYPGVARHVNRVVHIRDGRISAESFMQTTYRRPGDLVQQEFLVVDRVGRLQLPPDQVEQLRRSGLVGLASSDYLDGQVAIRPAGRPDVAPAPVPTGSVSPESPQPIVQESPQQSAPATPLGVNGPEGETMPQGEAPVVPESDPHAMFRRPTPNVETGGEGDS